MKCEHFEVGRGEKEGGKLFQPMVWVVLLMKGGELMEKVGLV